MYIFVFISKLKKRQESGEKREKIILLEKTSPMFGPSWYILGRVGCSIWPSWFWAELDLGRVDFFTHFYACGISGSRHKTKQLFCLMPHNFEDRTLLSVATDSNTTYLKSVLIYHLQAFLQTRNFTVEISEVNTI